MLALATPPDTGPPVSAVETRPVRLLIKTADKTIAQARAEGLRVPEDDENREEFHPDHPERLGWYWAYDDSRVETKEERRARYLADTRNATMKTFARIVMRGYSGIKDLNYESDTSRQILAGGEDSDATLTRVAKTLVAKDPTLDLDEAKVLALHKARKQILTAMPPRHDTAGITPIWPVSIAFTWGNKTKRLDDWYEYKELRSGGRPVGAKTRRRTAA